MNSVIFENDVFLFECFFNFQIGDKGDNYIQPDDNDTLRDVTLYIIGYHSEDGVKRMLDYPADATHIISESVEKDMHDAIEKKNNRIIMKKIIIEFLFLVMLFGITWLSLILVS